MELETILLWIGVFLTPLANIYIAFVLSDLVSGKKRTVLKILAWSLIAVNLFLLPNAVRALQMRLL